MVLLFFRCTPSHRNDLTIWSLCASGFICRYDFTVPFRQNGETRHGSFSGLLVISDATSSKEAGSRLWVWVVEEGVERVEEELAALNGKSIWTIP
jgi:hypothetical protein